MLSKGESFLTIREKGGRFFGKISRHGSPMGVFSEQTCMCNFYANAKLPEKFADDGLFGDDVAAFGGTASRSQNHRQALSPSRSFKELSL
jgi:hypothetical protein